MAAMCRESRSPGSFMRATLCRASIVVFRLETKACLTCYAIVSDKRSSTCGGRWGHPMSLRR